MTRVSRRLGAVSFVGCLPFLTLACASSLRVPVDSTACAVVGGILGAAAGAITAANNGEGETDEQLAGGGIGLVGGALIGSQLCGERATPMPPVARIEKQPGEGPAPLGVEFLARAEDPDGEIMSYSWDFGDGNVADGRRATHDYATPGTYRVRLLVTDNEGLRGSDETEIRVIEVSAAPEVEPRRRIVLRGINFPFDSATIREDDGAILDVAVEELRSESDVRVRVIGHTDSVGDEAYNQALSERRAQAVADYMSEQGIVASRLSVEGRGETEPLAANDDADGRAQNRRVALEVVE